MPPPIVSLIERLLNKDPGERLQSPTELLKALPTVMRATDEGQTITYQSLGANARRGSPSVSKKRTGEDLHCQIAGYRQRTFWSGGGSRFLG